VRQLDLQPRQLLLIVLRATFAGCGPRFFLPLLGHASRLVFVSRNEIGGRISLRFTHEVRNPLPKGIRTTRKGINSNPHGVAPGHLASYPFDNTGVEGGVGSHTLAPPPPVATPFGALVVLDAVGRLLTVREVSDRLRVSRATVYRLVQAGALPALRISNSIRIPTESLTGAVRAPSCLPTSPAPTSRSRDSSGHPSRQPEPDRETLERPR